MQGPRVPYGVRFEFCAHFEQGFPKQCKAVVSLYVISNEQLSSEGNAEVHGAGTPATVIWFPIHERHVFLSIIVVANFSNNLRLFGLGKSSFVDHDL